MPEIIIIMIIIIIIISSKSTSACRLFDVRARNNPLHIRRVLKPECFWSNEKLSIRNICSHQRTKTSFAENQYLLGTCRASDSSQLQQTHVLSDQIRLSPNPQFSPQKIDAFMKAEKFSG